MSLSSFDTCTYMHIMVSNIYLKTSILHTSTMICYNLPPTTFCSSTTFSQLITYTDTNFFDCKLCYRNRFFFKLQFAFKQFSSVLQILFFQKSSIFFQPFNSLMSIRLKLHTGCWKLFIIYHSNFSQCIGSRSLCIWINLTLDKKHQNICANFFLFLVGKPGLHDH